MYIYDRILSDFLARTEELTAQGLRPLSLSTYGDPQDARFAAVWAKASGGPLRWFLGHGVQDFLAEYDGNTAEGYYPTLVSATGTGPNARISGFFERVLRRIRGGDMPGRCRAPEGRERELQRRREVRRRPGVSGCGVHMRSSAGGSVDHEKQGGAAAGTLPGAGHRRPDDGGRGELVESRR
ncbi:hypothetical protein ACGFNU_48970 [Spirillospora sp. NPDC048911]|uniref:hypothetical protein n=1 Tax=Spirillospora sp. NPDC048911 TaxID=3364527 RepID=UPI003723DE85